MNPFFPPPAGPPPIFGQQTRYFYRTRDGGPPDMGKRKYCNASGWRCTLTDILQHPHHLVRPHHIQACRLECLLHQALRLLGLSVSALHLRYQLCQVPLDAPGSFSLHQVRLHLAQPTFAFKTLQEQLARLLQLLRQRHLRRQPPQSP
jgi:hypothetical protein